jgi:hypothetical protein
VNNTTTILKSISVIGSEIFYSIKGSAIPCPKFAPNFRATNTREPSGRSVNDDRKLAEFFPLAFAHLS